MQVNLTAVLICAIICFTIAFIAYNGGRKK